jgi:hypothetical protein
MARQAAAAPFTAQAAQSVAATLASASPFDETKALALQSVSSIMHDFLATKIIYLPSFTKAWDTFVNHVMISFVHDNRLVSTAAVKCLEKSLRASRGIGADAVSTVQALWERSWAACEDMGSVVLKHTQTSRSDLELFGPPPFTQECLHAFVELVRSIMGLGTGWNLDRMKTLLAILKGVLTYSRSPDYRPDIDGLTPVQACAYFVEFTYRHNQFVLGCRNACI